MTLILDVGDSGVDSDGGAFGEGEGSGGDGFEIVFDSKDETCPGGASGNQGRGTQKRKFCVDAALSQNMPINLLVEDETLPLSSELIQP